MKPVVRQRIVSGVILAAAGVGVLYLPVWGIAVVLPLLVALTQLEFYQLFARAGIKVQRCAAVPAGVMLACGPWLVFVTGGGARLAGDVELSLLFGAFALVCLCQLSCRDGMPLLALAAAMLGLLYVPFMFNFFIKLAYVWEPTAAVGMTGRRLFIYLLAVVKLTDVGAYVCGSLWGRHKFFPRISPAKTVEGVLGGLLTGAAAGMFCWWMWQGCFGELRLGFYTALAPALLLPMAGVLGDLVESMLKRADRKSVV